MEAWAWRVVVIATPIVGWFLGEFLNRLIDRK